MNEIEQLQAWFREQCDGAWEHTYGLNIGTLDNPGWSLSIDLKGTALEKTPFKAVTQNVSDTSEPLNDDWYVCGVEDKQFNAFGGPDQLKTILSVFLEWSKQNPGPKEKG
ncbi:MAG: hypothetical protein ACI9OU_001854 [Candidatus Promineifilaceae bacterium]|jgi:hypothetical protein